MSLKTGQRLILRLYSAAWPAALPFLYLSKRLRKGFKKRVTGDVPPHFVDVWIQAASGGEARLAGQLAAMLSCGDKKPSILATSCTEQGLEVLDKELAAARNAGCKAISSYFPFDMQSVMERVLDHASPKVVVLLETEIWPGLLAAAKKLMVPVVVVNGRMTTESLAGYLLAEGLFKAVGPEKVLATSPDSASRFSLLFGSEAVAAMPNMKFDAIGAAPDMAEDESPVARVVSPGAPFVVFGSVRAEEESEVLYALELLLEAKPKTIIGLFPRHMHRLEHWRRELTRVGVNWSLRSELEGQAPGGGVVLWDTFGELAHAYALARAAFVGGTLRPLGGQNFLEPLAHGVIPVIGPHYSNFAWVGEDIFKQGLVQRVETARDAAKALAADLSRRRPREQVKKRVQAFAAEQSGGTSQAVELIRSYL